MYLLLPLANTRAKAPASKHLSQKSQWLCKTELQKRSGFEARLETGMGSPQHRAPTLTCRAHPETTDLQRTQLLAHTCNLKRGLIEKRSRHWSSECSISPGTAMAIAVARKAFRLDAKKGAKEGKRPCNAGTSDVHSPTQHYRWKCCLLRTQTPAWSLSCCVSVFATSCLRPLSTRGLNPTVRRGASLTRSCASRNNPSDLTTSAYDRIMMM